MSVWKFVILIPWKIFLFLVIGYLIVPIFSSSSLCLDQVAENPYDTAQPSYKTIPCVKRTTIPAHFHPVYTTRNTSRINKMLSIIMI